MHRVAAEPRAETAAEAALAGLAGALIEDQRYLTPQERALIAASRAIEPDEVEKVRQAIEDFLEWARTQGAHETHIATHRRSWWSVGLRAPAPILCTHMARGAPTFVHNGAQACHLNIAHGLHPRGPLTDAQLHDRVRYLRHHASTAGGRVYAGGLVEFEPRELERLPIPMSDRLHATLPTSLTLEELHADVAVVMAGPFPSPIDVGRARGGGAPSYPEMRMDRSRHFSCETMRGAASCRRRSTEPVSAARAWSMSSCATHRAPFEGATISTPWGSL